MSNNIDPVLRSEEHVIVYVQDFAKYDERCKPTPYSVWWDGLEFSSTTPRCLVLQIMQYEGINNGM